MAEFQNFEQVGTNSRPAYQGGKWVAWREEREGFVIDGSKTYLEYVQPPKLTKICLYHKAKEASSQQWEQFQVSTIQLVPSIRRCHSHIHDFTRSAKYHPEKQTWLHWPVDTLCGMDSS